MQKNVIMIVSHGRADYGLLLPLIKKVSASGRFDLRLVATGTHLSPLHGKTIQLMEKDGIKVTDEVEMTMKDDTENGICSSISAGLLGFSKLFSKTPPDLLIVLGDRYELWSMCIAAVIHKIPIAHIHGGEATFGLIDESIRHSVTKMSAFHFVAIDAYAKKVIQMGESPERVFVVGALGLDGIKDIPLMTCKGLSEYTGIDFAGKVALMTYHPVTLDSYESAGQQIREVLGALIDTDLLTLITMPNADTAGGVIYNEIEGYSKRYPGKFKLIKNLGQQGYISAMKYARLMIGNSSSGIIETASIKLPVVNIGDRQAGRFKPANVIDCACSKAAISKAINRALSDEFRQSIAGLGPVYGDGNASQRIMKVLESIDFSKKQQFLKKIFYDLDYDLSKVNLQRVK